MLHKTNGTIENVFLQRFISAKKNTFFYPRPPLKIRENHIFGGFPSMFQTCVHFFWLMLHAIPVCHFAGMDITNRIPDKENKFFIGST